LGEPTSLKNAQQVDEKLKKLYWLIGRRSRMKLKTKLLVYKSIIKPVWTYGIQLWGTACKSNHRMVQRVQNKALRILSDAHPYHDYHTIHEELGIPWVQSEIPRFSKKYADKLNTHPNHLAVNLLDDSLTTRRLQRTHPWIFQPLRRH
ncbi:hypothetical protein KR044_006966, partial [Drosophila immigrans]